MLGQMRFQGPFLSEKFVTNLALELRRLLALVLGVSEQVASMFVLLVAHLAPKQVFVEEKI